MRKKGPKNSGAGFDSGSTPQQSKIFKKEWIFTHEITYNHDNHV